MIPEEIRQIFREELLQHKNDLCRFSNISDPDIQVIGEYVHSVKRLGDGDFEKGVELVSENHKWLKELRNKGNWASKIAFGLLVSAIIGAFLTALWEGLKHQVLK